MPFSVKIMALVAAVLFLGVFVCLAKKGTVKPFYSSLWLVLGLAMLSVVLFEKMYKSLALFLQIRDASFLVIIAAIFFLLSYVLHLSIRISEMSDRIQELISHVAILEEQTSFSGHKASGSRLKE